MHVIYELSIDGGRYIDGLIDATLSQAKTQVVGGSTITQARQLSFEPAFFVSGPHRGLLDWVATTINRRAFRKDVVVKSTDLHSGKSFSQALYNCLLADITLPELDKSSSADAYLRVGVRPERIEAIAGNSAIVARSSKQWKVRDFNFSIEGINTDAVGSVSALTVKQSILTDYQGRSRLPDLQPGKLDEGNFSLTIPTAKAAGFVAWHRETLTTAAGAMGRQGSLEYLNPQKTAVLVLFLRGVVPVSIKQSASDTIVELALDSASAQAR